MFDVWCDFDNYSNLLGKIMRWVIVVIAYFLLVPMTINQFGTDMSRLEWDRKKKKEIQDLSYLHVDVQNQDTANQEGLE